MIGNLPVNSVTINLEEYKELLLENKQAEYVIKEYEQKLADLEQRYKGMETYILNSIYKNENYDIRNLEFENGFVEKEYHYNNLVKEFTQKGITDMTYIDNAIKKFYEKYLKESEKESNE